MADSVDRVFVHALNTVKKIPKTGAMRPPPADRMRLYGLYKQAMEGDVDGVMERPNSHSGLPSDELRREQDKWDAWNAQRGLGRTEAKRRYIETLIETMHTYATTPSAVELVAELEFVWNQIKDNHSPSSSGSFRKDTFYGMPDDSGSRRRESMSQRRSSGGTGAGAAAAGHGGGYYGDMAAGTTAASGVGPLKVLSPMSEEDEADRENRMRLIEEELAAADEDGEEDDDEGDEGDHDRRISVGRHISRRASTGAAGSDRWSKKMERAVVKLSAEIAALREQINTGREFRSRWERRPVAWFGWLAWIIVKHVAVDVLLLLLLLIWMRRRKDRRIEDHVRGVLRVVREYIRKVLPSR